MNAGYSNVQVFSIDNPTLRFLQMRRKTLGIYVNSGNDIVLCISDILEIDIFLSSELKNTYLHINTINNDAPSIIGVYEYIEFNTCETNMAIDNNVVLLNPMKIVVSQRKNIWIENIFDNCNATHEIYILCDIAPIKKITLLIDGKTRFSCDGSFMNKATLLNSHDVDNIHKNLYYYRFGSSSSDVLASVINPSLNLLFDSEVSGTIYIYCLCPNVIRYSQTMLGYFLNYEKKHMEISNLDISLNKKICVSYENKDIEDACIEHIHKYSIKNSVLSCHYGSSSSITNYVSMCKTVLSPKYFSINIKNFPNANILSSIILELTFDKTESVEKMTDYSRNLNLGIKTSCGFDLCNTHTKSITTTAIDNKIYIKLPLNNIMILNPMGKNPQINVKIDNDMDILDTKHVEANIYGYVVYLDQNDRHKVLNR